MAKRRPIEKEVILKETTNDKKKKATNQVKKNRLKQVKDRFNKRPTANGQQPKSIGGWFGLGFQHPEKTEWMQCNFWLKQVLLSVQLSNSSTLNGFQTEFPGV